MFPWNHMSWDWGWGWGFVGIGAVVLLAILILPWFFFLLNLQNTLQRVSDHNRAIPPGHVWLNFIPVFNLGWFIYTVIKVRDSVRAEYQSRGWSVEDDLGYNVGLAAGILAICAFILGWVPVLGWGVSIAGVVCWIIYWLKTAELKNRLGELGTPPGYASPPPGYTSPPPGYASPPSYSQPPGPVMGTPAGQAPGAPVTPAPTPPGPAFPSTAVPPGAPPAAPLTEEPVGQQPGPDQSEQGSVCAGCGAPFEPGDRFCRACGSTLS